MHKCYSDIERRNAISSFARIDAEPKAKSLRANVLSGRGDERNGALLSLNALDAGYRIVSCEIGGDNS